MRRSKFAFGLSCLAMLGFIGSGADETIFHTEEKPAGKTVADFQRIKIAEDKRARKQNRKYARV